MRKIFLILILLACTTMGQMGLKATLPIVESIGAGIGGGVFGAVDLHKYFGIYPGVDFWVARHNWIESRDHIVMEFDINLDVRGFIETGKFQPYMGAGFVPLFLAQKWEGNGWEADDFETNADIGLNVFSGLFYHFSAISFLFEVRGKVLTEFDTFKVQLGVIF